MKVIAIIQARLGSTRCPRKVIREIRGKPLIRYVVERVDRWCVDEVFVITPAADRDEIAKAAGPGKWRVIGFDVPEEDVAGRFAAMLNIFSCDAFVRICADSPLIDPQLIDMTIGKFKKARPEVARTSGYPHGQQVEVVDMKSFLRHAPEMKGEHREHVTSWLYEIQVSDDGIIVSSEDYSNVRMVVDTEEDFENMKALIGKMDRPHLDYGWRELMEMM